LALAAPELRVTLVDAVAKKVAFMKNAIARGGLAGRVQAVHVHLAGKPGAEGLTPADVVLSRAFRDVGPFVELARPYVAARGRVVAMVSKVPPPEELEALAARNGFSVESQRTWTLPFSGAARGVVVFRRLE
jgi:16S rRNA (guanine527-N7)-methyltransferase